MTPIIKRYNEESRFVNWKLLKVNSRMTKIPYQINGRKASSTDPSTWSTYDICKSKSANVGIILHDKKLICIDLDHVLVNGKIDHEEKETIADLIFQANSYTEISQSGTGLHIFFETTIPFVLDGGNRKGIFEIYDTGRYIALTENLYGEAKEVRKVTPEQAIDILKIIGYPFKKEVTPLTAEKIPSTKKLKPVKLDDDIILAKMFASKNGIQIKALYDGDILSHDNDHSAADMALCSHLAFWTGKNATQIERLWILSPLGARSKTQDRKDYRDVTIANAIANCKEIYSLPETVIAMRDIYESCDLMYIMNDKKDKMYFKNTENIYRVLKNHPDFHNRIRFDNFKSIYEICPLKTNTWRVMEDADGIDIQTQIQVAFTCFATIAKDMVYDAITKVGKENAIDSAKDYMQSLIWDKKPRLDDWLFYTYGCPQDTYHTKVASNWLKGAVKRIIQPGCKFDYVLVLEGPQGSRKSTSLAVLGGDWHVETTMSTDSKDFFMQFAGKLIVEFSEGETLNRTETKKMKAIITTQSDRYRPPFGRSSQDFPRRCVFAMTTNQDEYLKDETGNRRWLPVRLIFGYANTEWLAENREQLFAEAYYRIVELKETIYEFPVEETLMIQNSRRIHDPNAELISNWYYNHLTHNQRLEGITTQQVYQDLLYNGNPLNPLDRRSEMAIADVLRNFMGLINRRQMKEGARSMRWYDKKLPLKDPSSMTEAEKTLAGLGW